MESEAMVFWQIFVAIVTAGNPLIPKNRKKIVDFEVGVLATHNGMELQWLQKSMVVSKPTRNGIQWM